MIPLIEKKNYEKGIYHVFLILLTLEVLEGIERCYGIYRPTDYRHI